MSSDVAEFFQENGYYVLRGAYDAEMLAALRPRAAAIRDRVRGHQVDGTRFFPGSVKESMPDGPERGRYTWGVNEITRKSLFDPALIDAFGHPPVDDVLCALLEEPRAWGLKLLWAPEASEYDLIWHRDIGDRYSDLVAYKDARNDHVQFNAALEPDTSFIVIPMSHRRALTQEETAQLRIGTDPLPGEVRIELEPGDIVFMDAHAYHRGHALAGAPRLSLHFSAQAQWVPLKPWGKPEDFAWITSDAFLDRLSLRTRAYYERLNTAERTDDVLGWMVETARRNGWTGALEDAAAG